MKLEELITVATFHDWERADALRQRYDDAGIPAQVFDESTTQRIWWFTQPRASMRVRVEKKNYERALVLLKEWEAKDHVLHGAVRCPECGGSRIEYPQHSRRTLMSMAFAFLSLIRMLPRQYYCRDCKFTWSAEPEPPKPDLDVLNWPVNKPQEPAAKGR